MLSCRPPGLGEDMKFLKNQIGALCVIVKTKHYESVGLEGQHCIILPPELRQFDTVRVLSSTGIKCFHPERLELVHEQT